MSITSFKGTFLSNMYESKTCQPTVEHQYQASKTLDNKWKERILQASSPYEAKKLGRMAPQREDWNKIKLEIMIKLITIKFQDPDMQLRLKLTGNEELIEGNYWHDNYWGSCTCKKCGNKGENNLGKILMKIRDNLR